jgi:hypothetical protein
MDLRQLLKGMTNMPGASCNHATAVAFGYENRDDDWAAETATPSALMLWHNDFVWRMIECYRDQPSIVAWQLSMRQASNTPGGRRGHFWRPRSDGSGTDPARPIVLNDFLAREAQILEPEFGPQSAGAQVCQRQRRIGSAGDDQKKMAILLAGSSCLRPLSVRYTNPRSGV